MKSDSDHESTSAEKEVVVTAEPLNEKDVYRADASLEASGIDEKKLMRKVDWHVIPWLALLYLLNFLDRGNVGNAKVGSIHCRVLHDTHKLGSYTVWRRTWASQIGNTL